MRLSHKLTLALTCAILVVLATSALVEVRREIALFERDMRDDSRQLGRAVAGAAARIWMRVGETEAMDVVEDANEREAHVSIRWVSLDAPPQDADAPAVAGLGRVVAPIAVTGMRPGDTAASLFTYVPVPGPGTKRVAIELRESLAAEHAYVRDTLLQAALATTALVVLVAVLTLGLGALLVGQPVRQLVEQARRIGKGDLTTRLSLRQRDEIGELAVAMNAMSDHLQTSRAQLQAETTAKLAALEQVRHADRLATVGTLMAGIAHEVGTPLNVITGYAQLIADECPAPHPANEGAAVILQQSHRVADTIRHLLDFARPSRPSKDPHDLHALAVQAVGVLDPIARKRGVTLHVEPGGSVQASVDSAQLQQVITNLVVNAIQASPEGSTISIAIAAASAGGAPASIRVRDLGAGIAALDRERIFEPFVTSKDVGEGTGLGLSVVYGIVKEHGGWIEVESEVGRGSCFTVWLPVEIAR